MPLPPALPPVPPVRRRALPAVALLATAATLAAGGLGVRSAAAAGDTTPPGVPGSLHTAYYGGVGLQISWGKVSASDTAGYRVYRSTSKTITTASPVLATTTALSYTDTTAVPGTTYYYAVAAFDRTGNVSKPSSLVTVKAVDTTAPATPSGLRLSGSASGVALTWTGGTAVPDFATYVVARATTSGGPFTPVSTGALTTTSFTDPAAPVGTSYYRVTAKDLTGNTSSYVGGSAVRPTGSSGVPATPTGFNATAATTGGVALRWTAVAGATGYGVSRSSSPTGTYTVLTPTPVTGTSWTDSTAPAGATAYYRLTAVNGAGVSAPASASVAVPKDTTPPARPSSLALSAAATGITLTWPAVTGAPDLAGYVVSRSSSASGTFTTLTATPTGGTSFTDTAAPTGTASYYRVVAVDTTGNASAPATGSATRPAAPTALPPTPSGLSAVAGSSGGVVLTWTANPAGTTTGYTVARAAAAAGPYTVLTPTPQTGTSYTDLSAPAGATAYYQLVALNAAGAAPAATTSLAVPADTKAPATPSSVQAKPAVTGGVTVTWSANKEPDLAGYTVQKRDGNGDYVAFLPATGALTTTTFTDPSVTEGQTAYYRVRAVDNAGNLSGYSSVTAVNPMVKPATPTGLKAVAAADHGVTVTWTANRESDLAGYSVARSSSSGGTYTTLTTLTAAAAGVTPTFADTSAPKGVAQYYKVTALDLVGNASAASSAVSATSTTDPVAIPVEYRELSVGPGGFPTVTAALATVPDTNLQPTRITIAPGTYRETFEITQPNVVLAGATGNPADVVLSYDKASGTPDPAVPGTTYGTADSYTVFVNAKNVTLKDLTVVNAFDEKAHPEITSQQAVALRVEGDRFVGDHVRLLGNQDTLLADTPKPTTRVRQYYVNSFIEGDVDYVFGAADAVFDRTTLHSLDRGKSDNGAITAASTDTGSKYGFLFTDSKVVSDAAPGTVHLGRPWHPSADPNAIASVVWKNTWLPAAIAVDQPWEDMATANSAGVKVNFTWQSARFAEYGSTGPGATVTANRPQLTASAAASATPAKYLAGSDGWSPALPATTAAPAAPQGLTTAADNRVVHLAWADDSSADVVGWNVYRSAADGAFSKVGSAVAPTYSDTTVSNGTTYTYAVTAVTRSGAESARTVSAPVLVAAAPLVSDYTVDPAAPVSATSFRTLTDALAAAPAGTATDPTVISVAKGTYREYPTIAKADVVVVGATGDPADVVISGDRAAGTPVPLAAPNPDGTPATYGTSGSATALITGNNVQLRDLTVENVYKEGTYANGQAVALRTTGDRIVLEDVRLLGNQDTFYANSPSTASPARVYLHGSYVEGDVDFLFGRATLVVDHTTLKALDHGTSPNGAVTAASTDKGQKYGFLITDSRIIGSAPDGSQNLGRPWQPGTTQPDGSSVRDVNAVAQVVVRDTWLGPVVSQSQTWTNMVNSGFTTDWHTARFSEYANSGPGAGTGADRPQLSAADAAQYTASAYLAGSDGWDPVADRGADTAPAAVTGLAAGADDKLVTLTWDESPESDVTGYRVLRDGTQVATVAKATYADRAVTNGTAYRYAVVAVDAAGQTSPVSAEVTATPGPRPLVADATVAADGTGDYTSLQAALNALPAGTASKRTVVLVKPGTYREVVTSAKPYLTIAGTSGDPRDVVVTFDNANGTPTGPTTCPQVTTPTCGTGGSYTVALTGSNVTVKDLTIANGFVAAKHPEIGNFNTQAVALKATGDKQVYDDVRLLGVQDTLLADAAGNISADGTGYSRQYFHDSFIEGNVDFIFGRATALFDGVTIHATSHGGGTVFAPSTASKAKGYLVVDSRIVSDNDPGSFALGRPWRAFADGAYADTSRGQVSLVDTWIGDGIDQAQPWVDFAPNTWQDGRFGEIGSTGPGATSKGPNRPQLAAAPDASTWLAGTDGWSPVADRPADTAPAAPFGVTATGADSSVTLAWGESPEADVVGYRVYRATGTGAVPTDAAHRVATLSRAGVTDTGLVNGTAYSYAVTAVDAAGNESPASARVTATPALRVDAVVAADGSGDYTSVQAAVSAKADGSHRVVIQVRPGTYTGTTVIGTGNVLLVGTTGDPADAVLTNGTATPTLTVTGGSVTVQDLTVANTAGLNNSPAVSMTGDKVLLQHVALVGTDRTVWADVPTAGATSRQLIEGSTITGQTNVVLGRATLVIHGTTITATKTSGTVLIPSTTATGGHGFLVIGSTITPAAGVTDVRLGGPYAQGTTTAANAPQAIVRDTVLPAGIKSAPWQDFNGAKWVDARFAEYANTGAGATANDTRPQLSPADSVGYTVAAWLGAPTWYPAVADPATPADVTAPAGPAGLDVATTDRTATLSWTAGTEDDLAGYRLYRAVGGFVTPGPGTLVRSGITGSTYTDSGLVNGTQYTYALVAVDRAGNTSVAATLSATPADALPPAVPSGLKAGVGDSRVVLTWTAGTETDLAGYHVYRAGARLDGALLTAPTFTETGLTNGTAYAYTVTAVDTAGNESAASAEVSGTPVPGDSTPPAVPAGVRTVLGKGSVTVAWTAVGDTDLAGYDVYRSSAGATPVKVGSATGTSYTDAAVALGTAYSYSVVASDTAGNASAPSATATATPVKVDVVVAADGSGDATTVAAGIALLADNADYTAQGGRTVLVKPGTYSGVVSSGNRYGVTLLGATSDATDTVVTAPGSAVATLTISGNAWQVRNLTLASTVATAGVQATALQVKSGDKQVFDNVRFLGDKQTLLLSTANATTFSRSYFRGVYVEGGADLVLGRAVAVFDRSTFHVLNRPGASLTDSSVDATSPYGFLITDSTILTDGNPESIFLGRPYSTQGKAQVVVRGTVLGAAVSTAQPWKDWDTVTPWTAGRFSEYQNTGAGAVVTNPATRPQLSDADAATYTARTYLAGTDDWNPVG